MDSGASSHMTWDRSLLTDYQEFKLPEKVGLGDGRTADAVGFGNVHLNMVLKVSEPKKCIMYKVLYVPQFTCNRFSLRAAASKGNVVKFGHSRCWIRNREGALQGMGTLTDKLYHLDCRPANPEKALFATTGKSNGIDLWHYRLAHICEQQLRDMAYKGLVDGLKIQKQAKLSFCEGCIEGKMSRSTFT